MKVFHLFGFVRDYLEHIINLFPIVLIKKRNYWNRGKSDKYVYVRYPASKDTTSFSHSVSFVIPYKGALCMTMYGDVMQHKGQLMVLQDNILWKKTTQFLPQEIMKFILNLKLIFHFKRLFLFVNFSPQIILIQHRHLRICSNF